LKTRALARPLVVIGVAACVALAACETRAPARLQDARPLMGTVVEVSVEGGDAEALKRAVDAAYREMGRLSDMMNHYHPDSVVSAINNAAGRQPVAAPPELMRVLEMARRASESSHGAFDITVGSVRGWRFNPQNPATPTPEQVRAQLPLVDYRNVVLDEHAGTVFLKRRGMRIDLGGIAKLPILDAGMRVLREHGIEHAMINGGGDVEVLGTTQGHPWRVGIRNPRAPEKLLAVLEVTSGFVVSSGDYERYFMRGGKRYHHILDPRTGYPTHGPHGVTLVSDDLATVNGLSAAVMVMGEKDGAALIRSTAGLEGLIVRRDDTLWTSPGLSARLHLLAPDNPPGS
jgi:thiamine biosynthesis lipoprotein